MSLFTVLGSHDLHPRPQENLRKLGNPCLELCFCSYQSYPEILLVNQHGCTPASLWAWTTGSGLLGLPLASAPVPSTLPSVPATSVSALPLASACLVLTYISHPAQLCSSGSSYPQVLEVRLMSQP
jgi:hypothetical protein